jgi:DNA repair protein RecN (Recombination protein N)
VAIRHKALRSLEDELARLRSSLESAEREAEYLRAAVEELEELDVESGEEVALAERRQFLMRAEKIAGDLHEAHEAIGGSGSPVPELVGLSRRLERKSSDMPGLLEETVVALNAALDHLEEARLGLDAAIRNCEFDPHELERTEERLFALRAAARKHQVAVDDLPAVAAEYSTRLAELDFGAERVAVLGKSADEAHTFYRAAAAKLSERRRAAAAMLETAVNAELPALKLEAASFIVTLSSDEAAISPDGFDRIGFQARTNPGTQPGPLMKVASGGELSRFLLALRWRWRTAGRRPRWSLTKSMRARAALSQKRSAGASRASPSACRCSRSRMRPRWPPMRMRIC